MTPTSNSLKLRVDYYQESPYDLQTHTLSLDAHEDNAAKLTKALVPGGVKLNRAAIEVINRCLINGDITTFVYRIHNTIIRACKLKGCFYTQHIAQKPAHKCYESIYHVEQNFDTPHRAQRIAPAIVPLADVFKRSNLTAFAYRPDSSMFFTVFNRNRDQRNSIPPAWFATTINQGSPGKDCDAASAA